MTATIIYRDKTMLVSNVLIERDDLWISNAHLARATGWGAEAAALVSVVSRFPQAARANSCGRAYSNFAGARPLVEFLAHEISRF